MSADFQIHLQVTVILNSTESMELANFNLKWAELPSPLQFHVKLSEQH